MPLNDIILIGGGGHCSSVIDVIESIGQWNIVGILDVKDNIGKNNLNYPIIGSDEDIPSLTNQYSFIITLGFIRSSDRRVALFKHLKELGCILPTIISPLAYVSKHATIGEGTVVMHHALVNANANIGANVILNSKVLVEHDAIIGSNCHISTGAIVNGGVIIGDRTFIGSGTVTKQGVIIPEASFIKANSLVR